VTARLRPLLHDRSTRVAAGATLLVGALYVLLALTVVAIVQRDLYDAIDQRLAAEIQAIGQRPDAAAFVPGLEANDPDDSHRFEAPLLVWLVRSDGTVLASALAPALPADLWRVAEPTTASVAGTTIRLAGGRIPAGWLVIGESTAQAGSAQGTVVVAELLVAPVLLALVFVGTLIVGRRVAGPLERARRRQLDFTADASHELRTPLTVIEAETSFALDSSRDPRTDQGTFERVHAESLHLRRIVDDMLWLARFDAAPAPPDAVPVDLGTLALSAAERFRAVCERRGLHLTTALVGRGSTVIIAPPEWLIRLVGVLVDNATKYAPQGGDVTVRVATVGTRVQLVVEDTGPGIPADERARVLDRFHRATDEPVGAGLGLSIADAVVRATNGRWDIGDAPGGGAHMAVTWSRAPGVVADRMPTESTDPAA
jgi:two-component system, OmpR family, sensor histidine kinase CiaH